MPLNKLLKENPDKYNILDKDDESDAPNEPINLLDIFENNNVVDYGQEPVVDYGQDVDYGQEPVVYVEGMQPMPPKQHEVAYAPKNKNLYNMNIKKAQEAEYPEDDSYEYGHNPISAKKLLKGLMIFYVNSGNVGTGAALDLLDKVKEQYKSVEQSLRANKIEVMWLPRVAGETKADYFPF